VAHGTCAEGRVWWQGRGGGTLVFLLLCLSPSPPCRLQSTSVGTNSGPSSAAEDTQRWVEEDACTRGLAEREARRGEREAAGAALAAEAARKAAAEADAEAARVSRAKGLEGEGSAASLRHHDVPSPSLCVTVWLPADGLHVCRPVLRPCQGVWR
jgi:hypothetical protein